MMRLITKVHDIMEFREETLFLATGLSDRYLVNITFHEEHESYAKPDLMILAIASILLAGKLNEQKKVCYPKMIALLKKAKGLQHITR